MFTNKYEAESLITFQCQCCGRCCRSGYEIFLDPLDVWNLRNCLKKSTAKLADKHIILESRPEFGHFPLCLIRMKGSYCPHLDGNLCTIHHARPGSCRIYPVAQYFDENRDVAFTEGPDLEHCPGIEKGRMNTVMGWLVVNRFPEHHNIVEFYSAMIKKLDSLPKDSDTSELSAILYNFDTLDDFPYKGVFSADVNSSHSAVKWIIKKATKYLNI